MKIKRIAAACLGAAVWGLALAGCSQDQPLKLANEISFSLNGISEIAVSYDEEEITFYESAGDKLTIKEYMTEDRSSYYARTDQSGGRIRISEGGKPLFGGDFLRCIEVYLPASYCENLKVTTTNGDIDISELGISLTELRIDSTAGTVCLGTAEAKTIYLSTTSGRIEAGELKADGIRIATTSGGFFCKKLDGDVAYTTTSGDANIEAAVGGGSYRNDNSGELNVIYTDVTGDLSFYNKNDAVSVTLPAGLEFQFEAVTKNGSVSTSFQECISTEGRTTSGIVGEHPTVTVKVETNNGKIEVKQ